MLPDTRTAHRVSIKSLTYIKQEHDSDTHTAAAALAPAHTSSSSHRPIIPWPWLHRITHARYYGYVALPLLVTLYIVSLTHVISAFAQFLFALLLLILLCACELTRYDCATCRHLMRQFETLFVCGYTIIHTVGNRRGWGGDQRDDAP